MCPVSPDETPSGLRSSRWKLAFLGLIALGSLIVMLLTGVGLFLSEPMKCYYSNPFWVKMTSLGLAILFTFTVRRKVTMADAARVRPIWFKLVALVSLTLWFGVGAGGRWIGFGG